MKDILKFAGTALLMLVTLTLVGMVFIQSFMGDYEWLNMLLTVVYTLAVVAAAFYDGMQRGTQDSKFTSLMEKQRAEHNYEPTQQEQSRMFRPQKGFLAGLIAASPAVLLALASLLFAQTESVWLTLATRVTLGAFLGLFQYIGAWTPWVYLPLALVYPAFIGIGYLTGPKMWQRQVKIMEKAKKAKRRRVNRKRKVKKSV